MRCTVWGGGGPYACSCHSAVPQGLVAGPERLRLSQPCTAICTAICKPVRTTMFRSSRTANAHSWLVDHGLMARLAWQRQKPGPRRPTVATRFADEASPANVRPFHVINSSAIAPEHCHVTSRWRAQLCLPPRCYSRSRPSPRRGGDFWTKNVVFRVHVGFSRCIVPLGAMHDSRSRGNARLRSRAHPTRRNSWLHSNTTVYASGHTWPHAQMTMRLLLDAIGCHPAIGFFKTRRHINDLTQLVSPVTSVAVPTTPLHVITCAG